MTSLDYSEDQLIQMGKSCYDKLILHCQTLEVSGFWEQAEKVMQQSTSEVLDLYVQAVLMKLAEQCGEILLSQIRFIQAVSCSNPLGIAEDMVIDEKFMQDVERVYNMPPILLQLCSLYDTEKQDDMTSYFVDALLNILQCMAYLNKGKNADIDRFIQEYYHKIDHYISGRDATAHRRYILHKLHNTRIECDVDTMAEEERIRAESAQAAVMSVEWIEAENADVPGETDVMEPEAETVCSEEEDEMPEAEYSSEMESVPAEQTETGSFAREMEQEIPLETRQREFQLKRKQVRHEQELNRARREKIRQENRRIREEEEKARKEREQELSEQAKEKFLEVKQRIQEREQAEAKEQELRLQALVEELNGLVGLDNVKEEIRSLINLIKIRKMREQMNLPSMDMSYHMVFTGSPGTGKTTVARLVAKIYKELGILSEGNLVETDRSGLVAGYVGQTAIKVHEIVEQAIGGILFIDEAYSLSNPDMPNDFGTEAVDTLVKLMEDHRDNLVVIVAGYTEEMQKFLKSNSGLISRFNKFIDFSNYSKEELVQIMDVMAQNAGLLIDEEAKQAVYELLCAKKEEEWDEFGNARGIRNMFEKLVMNQANRLVEMDNPEKLDLITIKKEDVIV